MLKRQSTMNEEKKKALDAKREKLRKLQEDR
jgi:hypothetical protein